MIKQKFQLNPNSLIVAGYKKAVIYDFRNKTTYIMNKEIGELLNKYLAQPVHYNSILKSLFDNFHYFDKNHLIENFDNFIMSLIQKGVITICNNRKSKKQPKTFHKLVFDDELSDYYMPKVINLEITNKCNLKCMHCSAIASTSNIKEVPYKILLKQMTDLKTTFGTEHVHITGGEPFLRNGVIDFLKDLYALDYRISVTTNAIPIKRFDLKIIKNIIQNVSVSLYGSSINVYKYFGGKKSDSEKVRSNILILKEIMGDKLCVTLLVEKQNITDLEERIRFCEDNKIDYTISYVAPFGKAFKNWNKICLTPSEMFKLCRFQSKNYTEHVNNKDTARFFRKFPCRVDMISIKGNGTFSFCPLSNDDELSFGNAYSDNISSVWQSRLQEKICRFNVDNREFCQKCEYRYRCGGGCLLLSKMHLGKLTSPFPFCNLFICINRKTGGMYEGNRKQ